MINRLSICCAFAAVLLLCVLPVHAQNVGINATGAAPDASAMLDVAATNGGMLIPRVALTQTSSAAPITAPATSLLVYNTATVNDVTPGFYFWNGSAWATLGGGGAAGWSLSGNAGTTAGTNYIGTSDPQALDIRTNDVLRFRVTNQGQLENYNAGSSLFIGRDAGMTDDLTDNENVFVGDSAGASNTNGSRQTAIGFKALASTTGNMDTYNTAVGWNTMTANNAIGGLSGSYNTAMGASALEDNSTGFWNAATGFRALADNTVGASNFAGGCLAASRNVSGGNNTAIGYRAMDIGTANTQSTYVGAQALPTASHTNSIGIGYSVSVTGSNMARIGSASVTSIGGYANWTNLSDGRFKRNVREDVPGLDFILELRPVTYRVDVAGLYDFLGVGEDVLSDPNTQQSMRLAAAEVRSGFIAQEVEQSARKLGYDFSGVDLPENENDHYGLRYAEFVVPMVKAMQEQQKEIEARDAAISELNTSVEALKAELEALKKSLQTNPGE